MKARNFILKRASTFSRGLGPKLLGLTLTPLLLLGLLSLVIYHQINGLNTKLDSVLSNTVPSVTTSMQINTHLSKLEGAFWRAMKEENGSDAYFDQIIEVESQLDNLSFAYDLYMGFEMGEKASQLREKFATDWKKFHNFSQELLNHLNNSTSDISSAYYIEHVEPQMRQIFDVMSAIELNNVDEIEHYKADATKKARDTLLWGFIITLLVSLSFSIVMSLKLINVFSKMSTDLNSQAHSLKSSSENLFSTSDSLSKSSVNASSSIDEVSSSMTEIKAMMAQCEEHSKSALDLSHESVKVIGEGREIFSKIKTSVEEIDSTSREFNHVVEDNNNELRRIINLIEEIGEKAKSIDDIVFQTKLLSFNASVEASRAGEHGKGFAVVASEIGTLAENSGVAAKEISRIISGGKELVDDVLDKAKNSLDHATSKLQEQVKDCEQNSTKGLEKMFQIEGRSKTLSDAVVSISEAIKEQYIGVEQVSRTMDLLSEQASENSEHSSRIKETAKSGLTQADSIREVVDALVKVVGQA